jgi:hypothetical protein
MAEEAQIETIYLGRATGPTPEMEQAAPWITGGFLLVAFAFLLYLAFSILAVKRRTSGRWFTISGLCIVLLYFIFQSTVAQDAELRYGPAAEALSLISYGLGGLLVAVGYALFVLQQSGPRDVR